MNIPNFVEGCCRSFLVIPWDPKGSKQSNFQDPQVPRGPIVPFLALWILRDPTVAFLFVNSWGPWYSLLGVSKASLGIPMDFLRIP